MLVKEKVRKAIKSINERYGTTVILTTHDLNDIEELCNRIIIIDAGKIIYEGNLQDLKRQFGQMATIELQTKGEITSEEKVFIEKLHKSDTQISSEGIKTIIKFNKNNISTTELTKALISRLDVVDFSIIETTIEDIVKRIYKNEV